MLEVRFSDNNREIFDLMKWFDPKFWDGSADYDQNEISSLYEHFKVRLDNAGFDFSKVQKELNIYQSALSRMVLIWMGLKYGRTSSWMGLKYGRTSSPAAKLSTQTFACWLH